LLNRVFGGYPNLDILLIKVSGLQTKHAWYFLQNIALQNIAGLQ
jgi:hypothetical protein